MRNATDNENSDARLRICRLNKEVKMLPIELPDLKTFQKRLEFVCKKYILTLFSDLILLSI